MAESATDPPQWKVRELAPPTPTLSVAMIVRNEADKLADILGDAAGFADQIVVVDTGSTDATMEIARTAGAEVFEFPWIDDFAAARNVSFDHCSSDWIMWLDADDRVPATVQAAINALKPTLTDEIIAVYAEYRLFDATGQTLMRYERERIVRRDTGPRWVGAVHEVIPLNGQAQWNTDIWVEHRPAADDGTVSDRNLRILEKVYNDGDRTPRTLYYYANELRDHRRFDEAIGMYRSYLEVTTLAWEEYDARIALGNCYLAVDKPEDCYDQAMQAIADDPSRAEAYIAAAMHFYRREEWEKAAPLFLAATGPRRPQNGFSYDANYSYLPWDMLGVCYYRLGRQAEAIQATIRALELGSPERERLRENIRYMGELI